jgi:hypothetical protein
MTDKASKLRQKIVEKWETRLPDLLEYIEATEKQSGKAVVSPDVVSTVAAISLYESSRELESYARKLNWLTVAIIALTIVLAFEAYLSASICQS